LIASSKSTEVQQLALSSNNSLSSSSTSTDKTISHEKMTIQQQLSDTFHQNQSQMNQIGNNPFDIDFSRAVFNDNELFGIEFDKIRLKNEAAIEHNDKFTSGAINGNFLEFLNQ
jgi:hypothetical protein